MKKRIIYFLASLVVFLAFSCEEEGTKATLKREVEANTLKPLSASTFELLYENGANNFETIEWTAPDYGAKLAVTYTIEIDKTGEDFTAPYELISTSQTSATFTVAELNEALLTLALAPEEAASIQVRVRSNVNAQIEPVYSSVLSLTVTPYATTFPPIYLVGDAQSWNFGNAIVLESTGTGEYEGAGVFQQDGKFRMFAGYDDWSGDQWGASYFTSIPEFVVSAGDNDSNLYFNGANGNYSISVNLNTKTITMAPLSPDLYIVGDAQGWNLANALQVNNLGEGQYEVIGQFQQNGKFRFFTSPSWSADQYRITDFTTVDSDLSNPGDNDGNFQFAAATGIYKLTLSLNTKTIAVESATEPALYIIGQDQGWNLGNAFKLTWLGGGKYEGSTTFNNGSTFRLFDKPEWPRGLWNYPFFSEGSVTAMLENANDNDSNFKFVGTSGTFLFKVDLYNKTVEVSN